MSATPSEIRWWSVARCWLFYSACLAVVGFLAVALVVWIEWFTRPSSGATNLDDLVYSVYPHGHLEQVLVAAVTAATPWLLFGASRVIAEPANGRERTLSRWLAAPSAIGLGAMVFLTYTSIFGGLW